jgi:feruloyl-CoA synthase
MSRVAGQGDLPAGDVGDVHSRFRDYPVSVSLRPDGSKIVRTQSVLRPCLRFVHDYMLRWAEKTPDSTFLVERGPDNEWVGLTYGEAASQASRIAAAFVERGLHAERPVLILSGNSIKHHLLSLSGMISGVPTAPISASYSTASRDHAKLRTIIGLIDPGLVYAETADDYRAALTLPEMAGREIVLGSPGASLPGATPFSDLLQGGSGRRLAEAQRQIEPETVFRVLFTSGSTGFPKGVLINHRMTCSWIEMMGQVYPMLERNKLIMVDWLPWSHGFGASNLNQTMAQGGTFYIDGGKPLAAEHHKTIRNLREVSPTFYNNVPKGYELLYAELEKDEQLRQRFFAKLEALFYAGASLAPYLWRGFDEMSRRIASRPVSILSGWGLTESGPSITFLTRHGAKPGSLGAPLPGVEVKLVPKGDKMEARVRGPNITPGYWKAPEASAAALDEEGYFKTGDAIDFAKQDDVQQGFVFRGRVGEDFKLSTGTWVQAGDVRLRALAALGGLASDLVVTAYDRSDIGLLLFPAPGARTVDSEFRERIRNAIEHMNRDVEGASRIVARAMIMDEPASLDTGEMTRYCAAAPRCSTVSTKTTIPT